MPSDSDSDFVLPEMPDELELVGGESPCSYLPDRQSQMEYRLAISLTASQYKHLLEHK